MAIQLPRVMALLMLVPLVACAPAPKPDDRQQERPAAQESAPAKAEKDQAREAQAPRADDPSSPAGTPEPSPAGTPATQQELKSDPPDQPAVGWRTLLVAVGVLLAAFLWWLYYPRGTRDDSSSRPPLPGPREPWEEPRARDLAPADVRVSLSPETLSQLARLMRPVDRPDRDLNELRAAVGGIQDQLRESVAVVAALRDQYQALRRDVQALGGRTLDEYFEEWKRTNLAAAHQDDAARARQAFDADDAAMRELAQARETLERTAARARTWFDSLGAWNPAALLPPSPHAAQVVEAFSTYRARGRQLVQALDEWLTRSDLSSVSSNPGHDVSFFDVVAGRSGDQLAGGYRARLERRRADVVAHAKKLSLEWTGLRDELPGLLDGYYAVAGEAVGPDGRAVDDAALARALAAAQVQEIHVQPGRTPFDPSVHEAVPGARRLRADLAENTVVQLQRRGFFHEGKVLRRALVSLSSSTAA